MSLPWSHLQCLHESYCSQLQCHFHRSRSAPLSKSNNISPIIAASSFLVVVVCLADLLRKFWLDLDQFLDGSWLLPLALARKLQLTAIASRMRCTEELAHEVGLWKPPAICGVGSFGNGFLALGLFTHERGIKSLYFVRDWGCLWPS
jgi:hypothetical protein